MKTIYWHTGKADAFVSQNIYFGSQSLRAIGAARAGSNEPQRIYLYYPMKNILQAVEVLASENYLFA